MHSFVLRVFILCVWVSVASAAERPSDLTLDGRITGADNETYREVPFEMPPGVVRLTVEFTFTGREEKTALDIGLRDPARWRGWSGGDKNGFVLEEANATPSYLPGPLPPGTWKLVIGVPNIRKTTASGYTAKVWFDRTGAPFPGFLTTPVNPNPGWYRGDLHMHTAHSDGACKSNKGVTVACPVFKTLEAASARHLDFIAVTDHNTTTHTNSLRELAPYFDDLLLIPGREVTTFKGHANVFGPTAFLDFQLGSEHAPSIQTILDEVAAAHGVISINHPGAPSGEVCMGCGWQLGDVDFSRVNAIEAVNGGSVNSTGSAEARYSNIPFWEARLNAGIHITAIGGSDNHDPSSPPEKPSSIGVPTTVVHASELSQEAILEGIRRGHVFVDLWGSAAGALEVEATANGQHAEMGDTLAVSKGTHVRLSVEANGVPQDAVIAWTGDGAKLMKGDTKRANGIQPGGTQAAGAHTAGTREVAMSYDLIADGRRHWLRADVRGKDGKLLLLGNPIYFAERAP